MAAESSADGSDSRGGRPRSVSETGNDDAGTESRSAEEAGFEDCEDGEALERGVLVYMVQTEVCALPRASMAVLGSAWARGREAGGRRGMGWEAHLCIGEDVGGDNLVGAKSLAGVDKGGQNLARLPALACARSCQRRHRASPKWGASWSGQRARRGNLLLMDEGSGLLSPSGIVGVCVGGWVWRATRSV